MDITTTAAALANQYARDGIVFPIRALDEDETRTLAERFDALTKADGGRTYRRFAKKPHLVLPWLDAVVRHPAVVGPVTEVLGPDVLCWSSIFFAKAPGTGDYVAWHQDATYWAPSCSSASLAGAASAKGNRTTTSSPASTRSTRRTASPSGPIHLTDGYHPSDESDQQGVAGGPTAGSHRASA